MSNKPIVLVADPTFETNKISEHAHVLQFVNPIASEGGRQFTMEMLQKWVEMHIPKASVLYLRGPLKVDAALLDKAENLKAIVTISAGHDNIDSVECKKRGIPVGFAGSALTEVTAELCIGLLLSVSRRIPEAIQAAKEKVQFLSFNFYYDMYKMNGETYELKSGNSFKIIKNLCSFLLVITRNWQSNWDPTFMRGKALEGAIIGIFGLGRIGTNVAHKLAMFQPREIIFHNRRKEMIEISDINNFRYVSFEELLHQSDFLVITISAGVDSRGRFGWNEFCAMKNDAILVNVSRGRVVDSDDLVRALIEGQIGGAGLDVTDPEPLPPNHPLYSMANCVITPHIGSSTEVARRRMMALGQENVIAALQGRNMPSALY